MLVLAGAIPDAASAQQRTAAPTSLVFDGVTVVDVEHGKLVPDQRVVITGNRIQDMGGGSAVKTPKGAQVVDARGKYLIPGLWDMHAHVTYRENFATGYLAYLPFGVTGVREAAVAGDHGKKKSDALFDSLLQWRRAVADGELLGPRVLLAGAIRADLDDEDESGMRAFFGPPVNHAETEEEARRLVRTYKAQGADMIKTLRMSHEIFLAVAAEARHLGIPFGGHVQHVRVSEASDSGVSIIDHLHEHSQELLTACFEPDTATVQQCQPLAERFRRNGTWFVPTISIVDGEMAVKHSTAPDTAADSLGRFRIAHLVGLPIISGTDANAPQAIHTELSAYVGEGLTPLEALQSATLNPAKYLHGTDSLGTVAPGKLADLVLLDANPLEDIHNTQKIRAVVTNGRYLDRAALDRVLAEIHAKAKQEP